MSRHQLPNLVDAAAARVATREAKRRMQEETERAYAALLKGALTQVSNAADRGLSEVDVARPADAKDSCRLIQDLREKGFIVFMVPYLANIEISWPEVTVEAEAK
jgi:hypothetical protein